MWDRFENWLNRLLNFSSDRLLPTVIIVAVGILAIRMAVKLAKTALKKTKLDKSLVNLTLAVMQPVLYLLLALMAADKLGIDVTGVVALASVLTLAVSLSLQSALGNIFGGFTLICTKPFAPGDYVEIAGREGTVLETGIAYTKLATPDNKVISLPNSSVVATEIVNYTISGKRRVDVVVRCGWNVPAQQVMDAMLEAAQLDAVFTDPAPAVALTTYADGQAEYKLMVWCATGDYFPVCFAINKNVQDVFTQRNIPMATPRMTVISEK